MNWDSVLFKLRTASKEMEKVDAREAKLVLEVVAKIFEDNKPLPNFGIPPALPPVPMLLSFTDGEDIEEITDSNIHVEIDEEPPPNLEPSIEISKLFELINRNVSTILKDKEPVSDWRMGFADSMRLLREQLVTKLNLGPEWEDD